MRVLVLGGTTEASALAALIAHRDDIDAMLSLAGRTAAPVRPAIPFRIGGFGGADGLADYLHGAKVDAVIDATHPFARQISENAARACASAAVPLLVLSRPAWVPGAGDRWTDVEDAEEAADALGHERRIVFLTVGRLSLPAFARAPHHRYVVRSIDPPEGLDGLPDHRVVLARGPFGVAEECALMRQEGVEVLVTKNSGGEATGAKLAAARQLGLRVVVIRRPPRPDVPEVYEPRAAIDWLDGLAGHHRAAP